MTEDVIEILSRQFAVCPSTMSKLIIERPHGAALRRAPEDTAYPHRSPGYSILVLGQWSEPEQNDENISWVRDTYDLLAPHGLDRAYSNYLSDDEYEARLGDALGPNFQRLQALKDRYDPRNVFRLNQNIPPSGS